MRNKNPIIFAIVALAMAQEAIAESPTSNSIQQNPSHSKSLPTIRIEQGNSTTVSDFPITFVISNPPSSRSVRIPEIEGLLRCQINAYNDSGRTLMYSERGLKTVGAHTQELGAWVGYDSRYVIIKANETKSWNFSLHKYFQLEPGKWHLDLEVNIATNAEDVAQSNSAKLHVKRFTFSVKPAPDAQRNK